MFAKQAAKSMSMSKDTLFLNDGKWINLSVLERLALILVIVTPVFYLSVKHWISNVSVMAAIFSMTVLCIRRTEVREINIKGLKMLSAFFSLYALGIIISQVGRQNFVTREYLDQTRWLLGLPFFVFLYVYRINYLYVLDRALPIGIFSAWISSTYLIPSDAWGERQTISFIDPLTFGHLNLSLAMMCLVSAIFDVADRKQTLNTIFKLAAAMVGVYLSLRSGSRTGWLAAPVVLLVVFHQIYKPKLLHAALLGLAISCFFWLFYLTNGNLAARFNQFAIELSAYPWGGGVAPDTSVGLRITFYRLGYYYFSQSPLFGWGNRGYGEIKNAAVLLSFSSQYARDFAFDSLFHSEVTTQSVRYGIFGFLSVFFIFFVPIKTFVSALGHGRECQKAACIGLAFSLCQLVSSLSTEVYDSKGLTAFSAVILAGLFADIYSRQVLHGHAPRSS